MSMFPIFQLTWGVSYDDKFGLMFPSELDYESATFTYAIPVPILGREGRPDYERFTNALLSSQYYFPVDINGGETLIEGKMGETKNLQENYSISFRFSSDREAMFEIDVLATRSFYRLKGMKVTSLNNYVGKYQHPIFQTCAFIPLNPVDISVLNEAYKGFEIVFVGQTDSYGPIPFG